MADFAKALALVLQQEGGKVDDKRDPGGRTNRGVTQRRYDAWREAMHMTPRDVYAITDAELEAIYRNGYAEPVKFDQLPDGVGYTVFDDAVNSGTVEAIRELQKVLGVTADGVLGATTLAACYGVNDRAALIKRLCNTRLTFLRRLKTWAFFGRGWGNRVAFVRTQALAML